MRFADKARFIWKNETVKEYLNNLDFEIKALDLMLTTYRWYVPKAYEELIRSDDCIAVLYQSRQDCSRPRKVDLSSKASVQRQNFSGRSLNADRSQPKMLTT